MNSPISLRHNSMRSARESCADFTLSLAELLSSEVWKAPFDGPERIIHSEDRAAS